MKTRMSALSRKTSSFHRGPLLTQEAEQRVVVSKRLCTSGLRDRVRRRKIGEGEAVFQARSAQILMDEAGIEGVPRAHVIDHLDFRRSKGPLLIAGAADGCFRSAFHNHYLGQSS